MGLFGHRSECFADPLRDLKTRGQNGQGNMLFRWECATKVTTSEGEVREGAIAKNTRIGSIL